MRRFRACAVLVCVTKALSLVRVLLMDLPLVPVDDRCLRHRSVVQGLRGTKREQGGPGVWVFAIVPLHK